MRVVATPLLADPGAPAPSAKDDAGEPLFAAQAVASWGGLRVIKEVSKPCQPAAAVLVGWLGRVWASCRMQPVVVACHVSLVSAAVGMPSSFLVHARRRAQTDMPAVQVTLDAGTRGEDVADICVSGLPGWVAVRVPGGRGRVELRVWAPAGIEVFVRPPLPVGSRERIPW